MHVHCIDTRCTINDIMLAVYCQIVNIRIKIDKDWNTKLKKTLLCNKYKFFHYTTYLNFWHKVGILSKKIVRTVKLKEERDRFPDLRLYGTLFFQWSRSESQSFQRSNSPEVWQQKSLSHRIYSGSASRRIPRGKTRCIYCEPFRVI